MTSLISVIVNCHNGEQYLEKCISSIINQKYKNLEVIFFDNCSLDNSKKILENFKDQRIKYFYSHTKLPLYKARNEAIKKADGKLIAFLDVDDWWEKNYLSSREKFFEDNNYDLYNYLDKTYGIEASNWYENNPTLPHSSNPHIPTPEAPYIPLASNSNTDGTKIAGYGLLPDGSHGYSKLGDTNRGHDGTLYKLVPRKGYGYNQWVPVKKA